MGLLDDVTEFANSPEGQGLLSGLAGWAAYARKGTPWNNIGMGGLAGMTGYQNAVDSADRKKQNDMQRKMWQMQVDEFNVKKANIDRNNQQRQQFRDSLGTPVADQEQINAAMLGGNPEAAQWASFIPQGTPSGMPKTFANPNDQKLYNLPDDVLDEVIKKQAMADLVPQLSEGTAEIKNWNYAKGLPEEERQRFMSMMNRNQNTPSAIQEYQYFANLPADQRDAYLGVKRAAQTANLGDRFAVLTPTGNAIQSSYPIAPPVAELPAFKAQQAAAVAGATAGVAAQVEAGKGAKKADTLTTYIDEAEKHLKDASGSYVGAAVTQGKQALGISDKTTQANQNLALISGWMVSNVPRMEGPQSNYDVENYKTMAAKVGDPTVPIGDRMSALKTLRTLQQKYSEINGGQASSPVQPAPKKQPKTFDLLPSAKANAGRTVIDTRTGKKMRSDGKTWLEVK